MSWNASNEGVGIQRVIQSHELIYLKVLKDSNSSVACVRKLKKGLPMAISNSVYCLQLSLILNGSIRNGIS